MSESSSLEKKTSVAEPPSPKRQKQHDEELHPGRGQVAGKVKGASPNHPESGGDGAHTSPTRSGPSIPPHPSQMSSPYGTHGHSAYVSHPGPYHSAHPSYHHYGQAPPPPHHHHMGGYGHPSHHPAQHYPPPGNGSRWPPQQSAPPTSMSGANQGGIFRSQDPYYSRQGQSPARNPPPPAYAAHPPPQGHRSGPSGDPRQPVYGGYGAVPPHHSGPQPHHQTTLGGPSPPRDYGSPSGPTSRPSSSSAQSPVKNISSPDKEKDTGSVVESPDGRGNGSPDKDARDSKDKGRGKYVCGKCGAPKKGHNCPYQPKLKRRPDEPLPEMRNAAAQVEIDELMVIRRLNLEIQGLPQTYVDEATFLQATNVDSDSYTYNPGPYSPPAAGPDTVAVGAIRERSGEEMGQRELKTTVSTGVGPDPEDMGTRYASADRIQYPVARRAPMADGPAHYEQRHTRRLSPRPREHFGDEGTLLPVDRNIQVAPVLGERQEPVGHSVASAP